MRSGNECIGISVFVKLVQRNRFAMGVGHFRFVLFCKFVSGNLRPWKTKFSLLKLSLIFGLSHNICTTSYLISGLSLNYRHNVSSLFSGLFLIVCTGVPARILNNFYLIVIPSLW
jgi:hypothetical protein